MANDPARVIVGKPLVTGGILNAPLGTALPVDATTALNAAFGAVGYVTDDGVTKSESRDITKINAWGGDTIAVVQTAFGVDLKFKMAEYLGVRAQSAIYGDANVVSTIGAGAAPDTLKVTVTSEEPPYKSWIVAIKQGLNTVRLVIPNARISETGDTEYKDDDVASLDATLSCIPDSAGAYYYLYASLAKAAA
jgi:hypothetical protein